MNSQDSLDVALEIDLKEINQEIQSWTVVVSATGRAHHALEDGKGVHCTRKMHKVLMDYRSKVTE